MTYPILKKIYRCTAYKHDKCLYQKSSLYLKALKNYTIFTLNSYVNNGDYDINTTGSQIIVSDRILSLTKKKKRKKERVGKKERVRKSKKERVRKRERKSKKE